jgi:hypothetical protein
MTSLAVPISVDSRGPCAIYILTDSRITWDNSGIRWDSAQKAFASRCTPDIFGFCGDAFFPPSILRQILEQINSGLLFPSDANADLRHNLIKKGLKTALSKRINAQISQFSIYHGARDGEFMSSKFRLLKMDYYASMDKWYDTEMMISGANSYLVRIDGTGRNAVEQCVKNWDQSTAKGTSRAAVWSFCEALGSGNDPRSGGAPQLVGIWRKEAAKNFGFIWQGRRYVAGLEVEESPLCQNVPWFNELFERCDGEATTRSQGAQIHEKPLIELHE